jgi:hypothetical protein
MKYQGDSIDIEKFQVLRAPNIQVDLLANEVVTLDKGYI